MLEGIVIKTLNSYYYIQQEQTVFVCKLRGRFKKERYSITVGDRVRFEQLADETGIIEEVLPRHSVLTRPLVANVDQVVLTFAAAQPDLHPLLLDRFLVLAEDSGLQNILICINKMDIADMTAIRTLLTPYQQMGYKVLFVSAGENKGLAELRAALTDKISVFAGPSGVGKSTLLNALDHNLNLATGAISEKIKRGKHTTRLAQLMPFGGGGFVVDTPGFSATEFNHIDPKNLAACFVEFRPFLGRCKYSSCSHDHEPQCAIKVAAAAGTISADRYSAYLNILHEIQNIKRGF